MGEGPLTRKVLAYSAEIQRLVPTVEAPADWAPLAAFVAVDGFERVGTFCEVQDWQQYTEMLTGWASATDSFEATVRRITEAAPLVYYEIEERHLRGGRAHMVNSMTVFELGDDGLIHRLHVYLQQPR